MSLAHKVLSAAQLTVCRMHANQIAQAMTGENYRGTVQQQSILSLLMHLRVCSSEAKP